ncbi:hypothetical protein CIPAW_15G015600 [Carya illinoinensis]|uniref:Uncharacterized protein n=1 Tax=Carya illinoinensis TaxID=32201 RepID=A0A8T1N914_CARIL|nr:hypothetical protein CIPAW_15G015600 [Carya illinoinensis]
MRKVSKQLQSVSIGGCGFPRIKPTFSFLSLNLTEKPTIVLEWNKLLYDQLFLCCI